MLKLLGIYLLKGIWQLKTLSLHFLKILQEVRILSRTTGIICLITLSYITTKLWTRYPEEEKVYTDLFPFFKGANSHLYYRTYVWMICEVVSRIILIGAFFLVIQKKYLWWFLGIFILYLLDLPDFLLIFGEPFLYLKNTPIEYGLIKGIFMILICAALIWKDVFYKVSN